MMTNSVYQTAVKYVEQGWSVLPLKPNEKSPLIPWQEFQARLPTMEELKKWFQGTQNNIGIVTGRISNLSVIDADSPEALINLSIASNTNVLTRRGRHLYFTYSGESNSASRIANKIDVRGEGGFVVAPPSIVDGFKYRFLGASNRINALQPFPRQLLNDVPKSDNGRNGAKPNDWIAEALTKLGEGNRNATFTSVAGRLHRDGHSPDTILTILAPHAERVDFARGELENVIKSITRYENGQTTGYEIYAQGGQAEDIETFLAGEEKVEWIVPGIIAKSSIGFCAGLPETYKTWIMGDLAIEAAIGRHWLGMQVRKTKTLFVDQERFKGETRRRFKKMLMAKGLSGNDIKGQLYIQTGSSTKLNLDESFEAFRRKLSEIRPELVIVDSFATFHTTEENNRQDVQKVLERVKQLRQEFGCTIIFIDHENKSVLSPDNKGEMPDAFKMVGSVGKPAAAELVLTVRKESDTSVTVYNTKNSLAPAIAPITLQITDTANGGVRLEKL